MVRLFFYSDSNRHSSTGIAIPDVTSVATILMEESRCSGRAHCIPSSKIGWNCELYECDDMIVLCSIVEFVNSVILS